MREFIYKLYLIIGSNADLSNMIQILKYGSDPLQTYLPDSDIDITIIANSKFIKNNSVVEFKNSLS